MLCQVLFESHEARVNRAASNCREYYSPTVMAKKGEEELQKMVYDLQVEEGFR